MPNTAEHKAGLTVYEWAIWRLDCGHTTVGPAGAIRGRGHLPCRHGCGERVATSLAAYCDITGE